MVPMHALLRHSALLLVAGSLLLPGAAAGEPSESVTDCLDPLGLLLCATAKVAIDLKCFPVAGGRGQCDATVHWSWVAGSQVLPGDATRSGSALIEFCPPGGGLCRGFGVGLLVTTCSFSPLQPTCGASFDYALSTGSWPMAPGECLAPTVTAFGRMVASPVSAAFGSFAGGLLQVEALATPEAAGSVCG